ncbi:MAG: ABC transporter ATP-binding protein [Rubripirellula sp.]
MNTSTQTELAVRVEHLSRRFRNNQALCDVNLQIPVGSIFGLVGLNGAGKTTLIRHLIGSLRAQQGHVTVLGEDPVANPESVLKHVGYLTEEDSLAKWMRIGDLIDFTRAVYPTWDDSYADELSDMFSLSRGTRLKSLSKGQRARVGLLVAIAHRPQLLVLDEPSSGLDPIARRDILEAIIRTISEDGRTVLFSSHLLDEVDRVCDTVALMKDGQILDSLTIEQLEARYCEVVCCPSQDWPTPPEIQGLFGWRQTGKEWSVMVDTRLANLDAESERLGILERRDISLDRWFSAKVGDGAENDLKEQSIPSDNEESDSSTEAIDA